MCNKNRNCGCGSECKTCRYCLGGERCGKEMLEEIFEYGRLVVALSQMLKAIDDYVQSEINEVEAELDADDNVVCVYDEDGGSEIIGRRDCVAEYEDEYDFDEENYLEDYSLLIAYDSSRLVTVGGNTYLVDAPLMLFEINDGGNVCSIDRDTLSRAGQYLVDNKVELTVDGESYTAYRIEV